MPHLDTPQRARRPRRRLRAARTAVLAGALAATACVAWSAGSALAAPAPLRIPGDHHSPAVAEQALVALGAHDTFSLTGTPRDFVAYVTARDAAADAVAWEMALDPAAVRAAWARGDMAHQEAVLAALTQLGVAYRYAASAPGVAFDCSGLTAFAWERAGLPMAHQSGSQIAAAGRRDESSALAGDLVQYPGHVMLYLGVGRAIVHASNPSTDVELSFVDRDVRFGDPEG